MRDEARFLSGRKITSPPHLFLGAAANPFAPPYEFRAAAPRQEGRRRARSSRRRSTASTCRCSEPSWRRCATSGCTKSASSSSASGPLASARAANWIRANVPGIHIPDAIIARLEGAENQKLEGKKICIEIMQECREIAGVAGVHVMAYRQEELVAEIVHESGVLAGRRPWRREAQPDDARVAERLQDASSPTSPTWSRASPPLRRLTSRKRRPSLEGPDITI